MYLKKIKIGNVELENNILLAPMAGITDLAFRKICKEQGAGLVTTEMISSRAICYDDEKTLKMINMKDEKRPVSIQIFGNDPEIMKEATKKLEGKSEIIDINMGCPAPKVVKNGDGSKLLLDIDLAKRIVEGVVSVSTVPVTVKMRIGWDELNVNGLEFAKAIEDAGASAITVHGRTRSQFYSGKTNIEMIRKIKEAVNIPVIGNGDIVDEISAKEMFEKTNVDGIMIGRGSLGNPWIFKHVISYLETGNILNEESIEEKREMIKKHFLLMLEEKGEYVTVREMRKHIAWYSKNMKNASKFKCEINSIQDKEEFLKKIYEFFS